MTGYLIPAFSIGRTQELLFDIEQLLNEYPQDVIKHIPIVLDSPMAKKFTEGYRQFKTLWSAEAKAKLSTGRHPLNFKQLVCINSHQQHQALVNRLQNSAEPCIVIAASGMASGGRIVNYLKALLEDERTDVVMVGYQAKGTAGRALFKGEPEVSFDDETVQVKAQIHRLGGYSAHADCNELIDFIRQINGLQRVRVVHGEPKSQTAFKDMLLDYQPRLQVELAYELDNDEFV